MPRDADPADAGEWLRRAQSSLCLAKQPRPEGVDWADLCYLAQQAAEKAIKAVYRYRNTAHRFTHSLGELAVGLEHTGLNIPQIVKNAVVLTRYAVETRYPTLAEPVTEEEYRQAAVLAEAVVEWARQVLAGR